MTNSPGQKQSQPADHDPSAHQADAVRKPGEIAEMTEAAKAKRHGGAPGGHAASTPRAPYKGQ